MMRLLLAGLWGVGCSAVGDVGEFPAAVCEVGSFRECDCAGAERGRDVCDGVGWVGCSCEGGEGEGEQEGGGGEDGGQGEGEGNGRGQGVVWQIAGDGGVRGDALAVAYRGEAPGEGGAVADAWVDVLADGLAVSGDGRAGLVWETGEGLVQLVDLVAGAPAAAVVDATAGDGGAEAEELAAVAFSRDAQSALVAWRDEGGGGRVRWLELAGGGGRLDLDPTLPEAQDVSLVANVTALAVLETGRKVGATVRAGEAFAVGMLDQAAWRWQGLAAQAFEIVVAAPAGDVAWAAGGSVVSRLDFGEASAERPPEVFSLPVSVDGREDADVVTVAGDVQDPHVAYVIAYTAGPDEEAHHVLKVRVGAPPEEVIWTTRSVVGRSPSGLLAASPDGGLVVAGEAGWPSLDFLRTDTGARVAQWDLPEAVIGLAMAPAAIADGCDGVDNDCDGEVDEGRDEVCNGADDDCDDEVDERLDEGGDPEVGADCATGQLGVCAAGRKACEVGELRCVPLAEAAAAEVCDDLDNDCDGQTDEEVPALYGPPRLVGAGLVAGAPALVGTDEGFVLAWQDQPEGAFDTAIWMVRLGPDGAPLADAAKVIDAPGSQGSPALSWSSGAGGGAGDEGAGRLAVAWTDTRFGGDRAYVALLHPDLSVAVAG